MLPSFLVYIVGIIQVFNIHPKKIQAFNVPINNHFNIVFGIQLSH